MSLSSSFSGSSRPGVPPLEVRLLREGIPESLHRGHAVVCEPRGRGLMRAGDPQRLRFERWERELLAGDGQAPRNTGGSRSWGPPALLSRSPSSRRASLRHRLVRSYDCARLFISAPT